LREKNHPLPFFLFGMPKKLFHIYPPAFVCDRRVVAFPGSLVANLKECRFLRGGDGLFPFPFLELVLVLVYSGISD
jgi:hypothetical protein